MKGCLAWVAALSAATLLFSQSQQAPLAKVYVGSDGLAHIVDAAGKDTAFPKEQGQVAVDSPQLSSDRQSAGWLLEEDNCCTSYPIPTGVFIYSHGKKWRLGTGQMIYDWCFLDGGKELALSAGPVHNPEGQDLRRFDSSSGKLLQSWSGDLDAERPGWAACLKQ
ncbi:MAG TPA: hypothetical protein VFW25_11055 [Silvibacterium sp.]|nr:hypothetical protein [Silvibacterium sp.]